MRDWPIAVGTWRSGAASSQGKGETKHGVYGDSVSPSVTGLLIHHCVNYVETGENAESLGMRAYSTPSSPPHGTEMKGNAHAPICFLIG